MNLPVSPEKVFPGHKTGVAIFLKALGESVILHGIPGGIHNWSLIGNAFGDDPVAQFSDYQITDLNQILMEDRTFLGQGDHIGWIAFLYRPRVR